MPEIIPEIIPEKVNDLAVVLIRLAQLQQENVDKIALQAAVQAATNQVTTEPIAQLKIIAEHLQLPAPRKLAAPDAAVMPVLLYQKRGDKKNHWGILRAKNSQNQWVSEWWDADAQRWIEQADADLHGDTLAAFKLRKPYVASNSAVYQFIRHEVFAHKRLLLDAVIGGIVINIVALTSSFYSMQVYDRVVPTGAMQTLWVLTLGVVIAVLFELVARHVRAQLYHRLIDQVDQRLARAVYLRFLSIRVDQLPQSTGALAGQLRGYETVRGFFTAITTNLLVDAPFALLFTAIIYAIAGPLAMIPLLFLGVSLAVGCYHRQQMEACAQQSMAANNLKVGLLVETVEGAEIIKSGQGGWRMLSRWMQTTDKARDNDMRMRNISEHAQHLGGAFQQLSYVLLVASGALLITQGELTMGGLIACSILSGRVLAPMAAIPAQLMQWAHAKAALQGLDRIWSLPDDHHGQAHPMVLESIRGDYQLNAISFAYADRPALQIAKLNIMAGEKIAVLGPIGAGKTTLLRLLSGMYQPQQGRILLDDVELAHIAKPALAERMGYVAQEGRLFSGTLRDNLILGMLDPGEEKILQVARVTGLWQAVIAPHPKGLQQAIFEGGSGLSGGQKQLVNLTRAFLRQPRIWLLDEPTASMDRTLELHIMQALKTTIQPQDTLILVTHKSEMLALVDRIIVIANHQIMLDGPKADVLRQLQHPQHAKSFVTQQEQLA